MSVSKAPAFDFLSRPAAVPAEDRDVVALGHPEPPTPPAPRKKVRICFDIDPLLCDEITAEARRVGISRSAALSQAARKWVAEVKEFVPVTIR